MRLAFQTLKLNIPRLKVVICILVKIQCINTLNNSLVPFIKRKLSTKSVKILKENFIFHVCLVSVGILFRY